MKAGRFLMFWAMLFLASVLVSCQAGSELVVMGFSPPAPTTDIDAKGATYVLKVKASGDWSIKEGDIVNATSSVMSGSTGEVELTLTVGPNPSTTAPRPVSVRFSLAAATATQGFIVWRATQAANLEIRN